MTAPLFVIVNPAAGAGRTSAIWPGVQTELRRLGLAYEYELTQGPLTATSFVRQALRAGAEQVLVVGGDGTVNEAVNGFFLGEGPVRAGASLAIVPAGSSSDLARSLGIPRGLAAFRALDEGKTIEVDVGRACFNDFEGRPTVRYFANNADVGIGGRIAAGGGRFKWAGGGIAFLLSTVQALARPEVWEGTVALDGAEGEPVRAVSVFVALAPYTGGGMRVAPAAKSDDGLFDVVTIQAMSREELLWNLPRIYAGTHLSHPKVRHARASEVRVSTEANAPIELDGEVVGAGSAEFQMVPRGLRVWVPRP